jgi:hypothetical protein
MGVRRKQVNLFVERAIQPLAATEWDMSPLLMKAQIAREMLDYSNDKKRIELLRQTLQGLATNSTNCKMCKLHNEIYNDALARDDKLAR